MGAEFAADARQQLSSDAAVDQQRLSGVAGAVALGLEFSTMASALSASAAPVIDMAVAVEMLDDRHPRFARDALDQTFAAARDNHVHKLGQG